jgi:hypothetical protein
MPLPTLRDGAAHNSIGAGGAGGGAVAVAEAVAEAVAVGKDADTEADLEGEPDATDREAEVDLEGEPEGESGGRQNIKSVESKLGEYTHPYEAPCKEHVGPFTISHPVKRVLQITSAFSWMNAHVGWLAHDVLTDNDATEYPFTGIKSKAKAKTPTSRSIYFRMRYKREV